MNMSQYMSVFIDESREHLQLLNDAMLKIEKEPDDISIVEEIFRSAHTLKGMSATMGFSKTAELTHHMENILDQIRNSKLSVTPEIVDVLFECLDTLNLLIDEVIEEGQEKTEIEVLVGKLEVIDKGGNKQGKKASDKKKVEKKVEKKETPVKEEKKEVSVEKEQAVECVIELNEYEKQLIQEANQQNLTSYLVKVTLDDGCLLKAARTYMVFRNLEEMGEIIKSVPSAEELEEEKFDSSFYLAYITKKSVEEVEKSIMSISEVSKGEVSNLVCDSTEEEDQEDEVEIEDEVVDEVVEVKKDKQPPKNVEKIKKTTTVRVDTQKLDSLMNLVAELVINKTRLAQIGNEYNLPELSETLSHIDRVSSDLQAVVTKVRMVPIESVFNRFPRMVRDLAKGLSKELELKLEGKETELDRTVVDEIGDPLVHLLRNSLDHGIETPEVRKAAGKPVQGTILLKAEHEGNSVVITISDDGKGIDCDVIGKKAVEKGIVTQEELDNLGEKEILNFIFASGFSTASTITDVSGRGVGMDVVRNKIEGLNGVIELSSEKGKGTHTRIKLPLTLAIIEALLVEVGEEIYAIPLANIVETLDILKSDIKVVQNEEVIVLRGEIVPIVDLGDALDVQGDKRKSSDNYTVVIVKIGDKKIGLIVEVLIGQQEVVIKPLGKLFTGIRGITGATVLGTGDVAIILDVLTLI